MNWRKAHDKEEETGTTETLAQKAGPTKFETPSYSAAHSR